MSKKRNSADSSDDEQANEGSDAALQQVDSAKRGKFASLSDTTLHDLPREMLECILVKAVAMEVKGMKLAKTVWKEKADLVISRLRTVCSQWSDILTTSFFRNELHKTLDGIAQETIRLEILHQSRIRGYVLRVTTMKDEMFIFCGEVGEDNVTDFRSLSFKITVYDRNNMAEVKDAIALPGICAWDIAACNVSNCLYVLEQNEELQCSSILRIARDEEHQFKVQTWIYDLRYTSYYICVSQNGSLIITSRPGEMVSIYSPNNGFLLHEIQLSPIISGFIFVTNVIQKVNGNLVLAFVNAQFKTVLTEISTDGIIERQYNYSPSGVTSVNFADTFGRILINDREHGTWKMLDSELNLLDFTGPQPNQDGNDFNDFQSLSYNSSRNEVVGIHATNDYTSSVLTIFRLSED